MTARFSSDESLDDGVNSAEFHSALRELSVDDLEAAYTRALEAVDAVEQAIPLLNPSAADPEPLDEPMPPVAGSPPQSANRTGDSRGADDQRPFDQECAVSRMDHVLQPQHIVEAALFVGGGPLTLKRLAGILGQESSTEVVEQAIGLLNDQYADEQRPYEIRLQEGGYVLTLRPEFERIRDRVYGRNPKEVKLSQESLEVLAFVAYRQPVRCQDLEDAGKTNAAATLRQLLRRQFVRLHRSEDPSGDVTYSTTPRFLELFGLRHLDDLPLPDDLAVK